jgi:hypothetical protein
LAARQLAGLAAEHGLDLQRPGDTADLGGDLCPGGARSGEKTADQGQALPPAQPAHLQRQRYIPFDRVMRVERVALEHHGYVACLGPQGIDSSAADRDRARVSCLEPGNDSQEGRLPATRRAQQRQELAVLHGQRNVAENSCPAEGFRDSIDCQVGHGRV